MANIDGVEYIRQVKKRNRKSKNDIIDEETLELRVKSFLQNSILGNRPSKENNSYFIREKVSELFEDTKQQNASLRNPPMPDPKDMSGSLQQQQK